MFRECAVAHLSPLFAFHPRVFPFRPQGEDIAHFEKH